MKVVGSLLGILSLLGMLIAFIPLLGWLNWIVIPFAIIGLIICSIANSSGGKTMCIVAIIFGILRLMFGGGLL
jgi:hypothetical protein